MATHDNEPRPRRYGTTCEKFTRTALRGTRIQIKLIDQKKRCSDLYVILRNTICETFYSHTTFTRPEFQRSHSALVRKIILCRTVHSFVAFVARAFRRNKSSTPTKKKTIRHFIHANYHRHGHRTTRSPRPAWVRSLMQSGSTAPFADFRWQEPNRC